MRAGITCVGPLISVLRADTGLSSSQVGALNTLPLLAFAAVAAVAPRIAREFGLERSLFGAVVVTMIGTVVRSLPANAALFGGTALLGCGIGCSNVLLPGLIKRDFPRHIEIMTATYATTLGVTAAISSGVAVPIAGVAPGGWRTALGCWALIALAGALVWLPRLGVTTRPPRVAGSPGVWRSALAWQVTAFIGLQSFGFYVVVTWLPTILQTHHYSSSAAGWELFLYQAVSLVASSAAPVMAGRMRDQRWLAGVSGVFGVIGFSGLLAAPSIAPLWVICMGLGSGACFSLALSFFALRAGTPRQAAALSGMAQSMGYLFAAAGPVVLGVLHDVWHSWTTPLVVLIGVALFQVAAGFAAGRARTVAR